ncbi:hypothetical protein BM43_7578 (plasmid) [Burkholderia gladioli]|uniref:Uncharacterized protein n=1 Tax=Burkholderia gladioli TaxID=28095 RepID=A0AAW3FBI8_BURGA|nr:hypothetical protein BM43_7578 [Burkholderia gladioli]KGC24050.1 hypothetical protein DM48_8047 [Burkholderia gladioli]
MEQGLMEEGKCPRLARRLLRYGVKLAMVYGIARVIPLVVLVADQGGFGGQARCAIAVIWIVLLFVAARIVRCAWNEISEACESRLTKFLRKVMGNNKPRKVSGQSAGGAPVR